MPRSPNSSSGSLWAWWAGASRASSSGPQGVRPGAEYGTGPRRSYCRRPAVPPAGASPWPRSDRDIVAECRGRFRRIAHCPRGDLALPAFRQIVVTHGSSLCRSAPNHFAKQSVSIIRFSSTRSAAASSSFTSSCMFQRVPAVATGRPGESPQSRR